jgi:hypothetical protein
MARGGINKALVQKAYQTILARGSNPSIDAIRVELGNTGSKTTIHRYLKELEDGSGGDGAPLPLNEQLANLADSTPFGHSAHADPDTCSTIIRTGSRSAATQGWHC